MNLSKPDIYSEVYKQFIQMIKEKVSQAEVWLISHKIDYIWNYWIGNHLYRIYIPQKELLIDFEYFPINNVEYNYLRVNFNDDIILLLENIFPTNILDTQELSVYKLNQRVTNRFLKETGNAPVYDNNVLVADKWYEVEGVLEKGRDREGYDIAYINVVNAKEINSSSEDQYVYPCYTYDDGSCSSVLKYDLMN